MSVPRIAIFSYYFSESSLTLSKYLLKKGCAIDYYYFATRNQEEVAAFNFAGAKKKLGLVNVEKDPTSTLYNFFESNNIQIKLIRLYSHSTKTKGYIINSLISYWVLRMIKKNKYDGVGFIGGHKLLIQYHKAFRSVNRVHTIHEIIDHSSNNVFKSDLLKYLFDNNIKIVVHSQNSYNHIAKYEDCNLSLVSQINFGLFECYNTIDVTSDITKGNTNYVLVYGLVRPYKGFDTLVEAIKALQQKGRSYTFVVAGAGYVPEVEELKTFANVVLINKKLSNSEIIELNMNARMVVCPYKSASQSGIPMTSFLYHKPLIVTNVGAFREVIKNGINGLVVPPDSPNHLAQAIESLFEDDSLYQKLVAGTTEFQNDPEFNWNVIADKTLKLLLSK